MLCCLGGLTELTSKWGALTDLGVEEQFLPYDDEDFVNMREVFAALVRMKLPVIEVLEVQLETANADQATLRNDIRWLIKRAPWWNQLEEFTCSGLGPDLAQKLLGILDKLVDC